MQNFLTQILHQGKTNNGVAIRKGKHSVTYSKLLDNIHLISFSYSRYCLGNHIAPGDTNVLFALNPDPDSLTIALGLLHSGATLTIVDPFTSDELLQSRAETAGVTHVLAEAGLLSAGKDQSIVNSLAKRRLKKEHIADLTKLGKPILTRGKHKRSHDITSWYKTKDAPIRTRFQAEPDKAVIIVFTSGTTDEPKGIIQTYATLSAGMEETVEKFNLKPSKLQSSPQKTVYSEPMTLGLVALTVGATWIIPDDKDEAHTAEYDVWFSTPHDMSLWLDKMETNKKLNRKPFYRTVGLGAAPILTPLIKRISSQIATNSILCVYGMTEILPIAIGDATEKPYYMNAGDYVGQPLDHVEVKIIDGEIHVKSGAVSQYINYSNTEWLPTGDYGHLTDEGHIVLTGRKKDMFIRGTMNIYPGLYEPRINEIRGIKEAALVGKMDKYGEDRIYLAVTAEDGEDEKALKDIIINLLPSIMDHDAIPNPEDIILVDKLPVSGRANKLNREELLKKVTQ